MYSDETIITIVILGLIIFLLVRHQKLQEGWKPYQQIPYGEGRVGSEPLGFYENPKYRVPYRWPVCQHTNHPFPHCKPLD